MSALTLLVPLLLAVSTGKPTHTQSTKAPPTKVQPAPSAEAASAVELTEEHKTLAEVALARRLPKWVGPGHRKQLHRIVASLRAGELEGARKAWDRFVKGSAAQRNQTDFDFVARWAVRQAYFADQKELDQAAYHLGRVLRLEAELEEYSAELKAVEITDTTKKRVFVRTLGDDGLGPKKAIHLDRAGLSNTLDEVESIQENVRNKRQMASTEFQNFDQKANQTLNLLSSIMKAMNEMRMGTVSNML
jgi:hypothetical protein